MKTVTKTISHCEARRLTEAFLDGQTSLEEERALFLYYNNGDIADDLEENREMMQWYAAGLKLENSPLKKDSSAKIRGILKVWLPAAAAIAVAFTLAFNLYKDEEHGLSDEEYAEYEGSYIIRNGKKITDLAEIMPEIKANEEYSERLQRIINVNSMTSDELIEDMIYTEYPYPGLRQDILNTIHDGQTIQYF